MVKIYDLGQKIKKMIKYDAWVSRKLSKGSN